MTDNINPAKKDSVLVRYGELGLKDNNRGIFEDQLRKNIDTQLHSLTYESVSRFQGGMRVNLNDRSPVDRILGRLKNVPGIAWFAPSWESERTPDSIADTILEHGDEKIRRHETFAITTQRSDKDLELTSQDFNVQVGGLIDERTDLTVDLDDPDWHIEIHLLFDRAYIFFVKQKGFGGLPVGASGEVLTLLSGGIDSPVASIKAFKRGCRQDYLHYYPYPDPKQAMDQKIRDLLERLSNFGTHGKLFMAPYHVYDLEAPSIDERDEMIFFRRHMMRVADQLAQRENLKGIVTGSSLGQVASQTLENLQTFDSVTDLPILKPLIGLDKQEIIDLAKEHGTYKTSIQNYQDCCSIQSKRVRTRSQTSRFESLEEQHDLDQLDQTILNSLDVYEYGPEGLKDDESQSASERQSLSPSKSVQ